MLLRPRTGALRTSGAIWWYYQDTLFSQMALAGKAVLIVSSYLPELMGVCDRIAVMCRGVLGPARDVGKINEHQIMQEAPVGCGHLSFM